MQGVSVYVDCCRDVTYLHPLTHLHSTVKPTTRDDPSGGGPGEPAAPQRDRRVSSTAMCLYRCMHTHASHLVTYVRTDHHLAAHERTRDDPPLHSTPPSCEYTCLLTYPTEPTHTQHTSQLRPEPHLLPGHLDAVRLRAPPLQVHLQDRDPAVSHVRVYVFERMCL